ncbi:fatty acid desaturase [Oscillatoria sp. CS-180]|uniref:fatty acid desaturase n=1 Tax=Oscillatoria sp. CS-180 TaxID=3021720 RepID=UPI00232FAA96|nr:fatty acid desaturase [Oscillatoria sp. CS-180]MDB9529004.1 fatty acid desaturase [Oscillatoria sp. CS-180]
MTTTASTADARQLLGAETLKHLNERSDGKGWLQLLRHLSIMGISGGLWATQRDQWAIALPALLIYGFSLASMFAAVHECVHRSAFASQKANKWVGWLAGLLSGYNSTFYRRYHKWHHRYTKVPGKDPELEDLIPTSFAEYLWVMSGIPWWIGKMRGHWHGVTGQFEAMPYVPESAYGEVQRSIGLQLAVYGAAITLSLAFRQPWFVLYWLLPLAVGQPILRFILIAEHTGCPDGDNPLTNTRTTLTTWPIKLLMWNMPFHAEHHLYPSIPFHKLPEAHVELTPHFAHVDSGYVGVNRSLVTTMGQRAA